MSKRLGPIHYIMFGKILFTRNLSKYIADACGIAYTSSVQGDQLEDVIDESNIHMSLQSMVQAVQKEHAQVMEQAQDQIETVENAIRAYGKQHPLQGVSFQEIMQKFEQLFLYGMPCDRILSVEEMNDNFISISVKEDQQAKYFSNPEMWSWEQTILVNEMLDGYSFARTDSGFTIRGE